MSEHEDKSDSAVNSPENFRDKCKGIIDTKLKPDKSKETDLFGIKNRKCVDKRKNETLSRECGDRDDDAVPETELKKVKPNENVC